MAKEDTLKLDIEELRKLIDLNRKELERFNLTDEDRVGIQQNIEMHTAELKELLSRSGLSDA